MKRELTPTFNPKQIKRMKKELGKLNKKIRHSKKKHNNLMSKRNSIKKKSKSWKDHDPKNWMDHENPKNPLTLLGLGFWEPVSLGGGVFHQRS